MKTPPNQTASENALAATAKDNDSSAVIPGEHFLTPLNALPTIAANLAQLIIAIEKQTAAQERFSDDISRSINSINYAIQDIGRIL